MSCCGGLCKVNKGPCQILNSSLFLTTFSRQAKVNSMLPVLCYSRSGTPERIPVGQWSYSRQSPRGHGAIHSSQTYYSRLSSDLVLTSAQFRFKFGVFSYTGTAAKNVKRGKELGKSVVYNQIIQPLWELGRREAMVVWWSLIWALINLCICH